MNWFYESLEQHYDEFSFFGGANVGAPSPSGKIDREWFYYVQNQFNTENTIIMIHLSYMPQFMDELMVFDKVAKAMPRGI